MNGKFRVWDGRKYHYNAALVNGIAMIEENPQRSDKITVGGIDYYSDWAKYKPVKWANENKKGEIVVEFCTGLSASKSYRGTKPEDLEIYTGDVVRITIGTLAYAAPVTWGHKDKDCEYNGAWFCDFGFINEIAMLHVYYRSVEIVGNIHGEVQK